MMTENAAVVKSAIAKIETSEECFPGRTGYSSFGTYSAIATTFRARLQDVFVLYLMFDNCRFPFPDVVLLRKAFLHSSWSCKSSYPRYNLKIR